MFCKIWDDVRTWFTNQDSDYDCSSCIKINMGDHASVFCPYLKKKCKVGQSCAHQKKIFLCCTEDECRNKNRFIERFSLIKSEIPFLISFILDAEQQCATREREKYSKIVHNLKSLNAQSIATQSVFIPQINHQTYRDVFSIVQDKVKEQPRAATLTLLKLAKNNQHMKTEFTTHEKLSFDNPVLFKQKHNIKTVILNVYHSFDMEFREKRINLNISNEEIYLFFDFDTIRVALYHMFSNAIKYMKGDSDLNISFSTSQADSSVEVIFDMRSLFVLPEERDKIFKENYSGKQAVEHKLNGSGLGLGYIKKALKINDGTFYIIFGEKGIRYKGLDYADNQFVFSFSLQSR